MKAFVIRTRETLNVIHVGENIVIALDPKKTTKDQRVVLNKDEVRLGEKIDLTRRKKKRKRLAKHELIFTNSPCIVQAI